jgi:hypothetical protein
MHPTANQVGFHSQDAVLDALDARRVMPGAKLHPPND